MTAFYTEIPERAAMAIQYDLPEEAQEALELEAEACYRKSPYGGEKIFYEVRNLEEVDPIRVQRLRKLVEDAKPDWVERVRAEAEFYDDEATIIFWSEVPPEPALAILENLQERGELPLRD